MMLSTLIKRKNEQFRCRNHARTLTHCAKNITSQLLFIEEANQLHAFLKRQHFQKQQQISKKIKQ